MLTVLPVRDSVARACYSEQCDDILLAEDDSLPLGYIAISVCNGCVHVSVLKLYVNESSTLTPIETADLLIRAAMSYGLNRNCVRIQSAETYPKEAFERLGFLGSPETGIYSAMIAFPSC